MRHESRTYFPPLKLKKLYILWLWSLINRNIYFRVTDGGMLIGWMRSVFYGDYRVAYQDIWYVENRRSGAAIALLRDFEQWARAADRIVVSISTGLDNRIYTLLARRGYGKMGELWNKDVR